MHRWFFVVLCALLLAPLCAEVGIIDLPATLGESYDLSWSMHGQAPSSSPLLVGIEQTAAGEGYLLRIADGLASWERLAHPGVPVVKAAVPSSTGKAALFTLKRRADTIALLLNHRLLFTSRRRPADGVRWPFAACRQGSPSTRHAIAPSAASPSGTTSCAPNR